MGAVVNEAVAMMDKIGTMARKATMKNPVEGHDADDIVQSFLLKVVEKEDLYCPDKASMRTWLYTIAQNHIRSLFKKQARVTQVHFYDFSPERFSNENLDNLLSDVVDGDYQLRLEAIERKLTLVQATYNLLDWLKENDYRAWQILTAMLRRKANRYHASLEADATIREINGIITRIRDHELGKRLIELLKGV